MAWIKLLTTFLQSPALVRIRRHLGVKKERAAWLAIQWLFYLDENTTNGETRLLPEEIDDLFEQRNFAAALIAASWAKQEADGTISALDYHIHNGENTKKRLMQSVYDSRRTQKKTRKQSEKSAPAPDTNLENPRFQSGKSQTPIWTREEKRREENISPPSIPPPRHATTTPTRRQNDCNANRRYDL